MNDERHWPPMYFKQVGRLLRSTVSEPLSSSLVAEDGPRAHPHHAHGARPRHALCPCSGASRAGAASASSESATPGACRRASSRPGRAVGRPRAGTVPQDHRLSSPAALLARTPANTKQLAVRIIARPRLCPERSKHEIVSRECSLHQCRVNPHERGDLVGEIRRAFGVRTKPLRPTVRCRMSLTTS